MHNAPAPLFRDPMFDGPADPAVIWNREEKTWWIVYTQRRANVPCYGVSWVHGTDLGVASSADHGQTWLYRGTLSLEPVEKGRNTFWAPEILWANGEYHMFVSYITGVPDSWAGDRAILHYVSDNLWDWTYQDRVPAGSNRVIDACVYPCGQGWRLWYKDESDDSHTHVLESPDLVAWKHLGRATKDQAQEGPNVFELGGACWLITDCWDGLGVYRSTDLTQWERQEGQLLQDPGSRCEDGNRGHHADVLVMEDKAYIFYFVHPDQQREGMEGRRSSLQVAELYVEEGQLRVRRDEPFDFYLP